MKAEIFGRGTKQKKGKMVYGIPKPGVICIMVVLCMMLTACQKVDSTQRDNIEKKVALERIVAMNGERIPGYYQSPVDFPMLWEKSPDIIAWLDLKQIGIDYPVLYREGDKEFYLHHDLYGNYAFAGSIYIEDYNRPDFTDPVTVIYGHNMKNNTMFGYLEETYRTEAGFEKGKQFTIFLPDREFHYEVVAAVHHNNKHLLARRDFTKEETRRQWIHDVLDTNDGRFDKAMTVTTDDRLLVLATCTYTKEKRYLVVAKMISETASDRRLVMLDSFSRRGILSGLYV